MHYSQPRDAERQKVKRSGIRSREDHNVPEGCLRGDDVPEAEKVEKGPDSWRLQQMAGQVIRLGHAFGLSSSYRLLHLTSGFSRGAGCCYYVGTYLASYSRRYLHSTYIAGTAVLA